MDNGLMSTLALVAVLMSVAAVLIALWPCLGRMFLKFVVR
jgi:hypothetical protein